MKSIQQTSAIHRAAREYAEQGKRVLPLKGKEPRTGLTPNGVDDASTDPEVIDAWFHEVPHANVGIATGQGSGLIHLDLDSKAAFREAVRRGLPHDLYAIRGYRQYGFSFEAPDEPLRSFKPFPGAEVVSERRYIVAPPSIHPNGHPYRLWPRIYSEGLPELPEWILELAREHVEHGGGEPVNASPDGAPIPEGARNDSLFRVACSLRGRGADHATILGHLHEVNRLRCTPQLPAAEVQMIARSAATRYEAGSAAVPVTKEVHQLLDGYIAAVLGQTWKGGGRTDRKVLLALISYARQYGEMSPAGVRVGADQRNLSLAAGVSRPTLRKSINERLKPAGWLRADNHERRRGHAGAFVLLSDRAYLSHSNHLAAQHNCKSGKPLRVPPARWNGFGPKNQEVVENLLAMGGAATVKEVAAAIGDKRPWELRRRNLSRLHQDGIVVLDGDAVMLSGEWEHKLHEAYHAERESEKTDKLRYEDEREKFREGWR